MLTRQDGRDRADDHGSGFSKLLWTEINFNLAFFSRNTVPSC
jgi:hypothetical protein